MRRDADGQRPLREYFSETIHDSLHGKLGLSDTEDVEAYLAQMLVDFLHMDSIYAIRDAAGRRVESVVEMVAEGDVRLKANSFDRERAVHRHIGDFLLFWSGVFPEFLKQLRSPTGKDALLDVARQGQFSYYVVSTFEHEPYASEAHTFRKLSIGFDSYREGLSLVRTSIEGFARQGWRDGFEA